MQQPTVIIQRKCHIFYKKNEQNVKIYFQSSVNDLITYHLIFNNYI